MKSIPRNKFILLVLFFYAVSGLMWMALSDMLLANLSDVHRGNTLFILSAVFFILVTAAALYFVLLAVPDRQNANHGTLIDTIGLGLLPKKEFSWQILVFSVALSSCVLLLRAQMADVFDDRPMLILFILPILLCASLGGLWSGLMATAICVFGTIAIQGFELTRTMSSKSLDAFQWAAFIADGIAISVLCGILRHALHRAQFNLHLLNAVISGTSDAVFVKNKQGAYQLANAAVAQFLGKPINEIIGMDDMQLFSDESGKQIKERDRQIMESGTTQYIEEHVTMHDGKEYSFSVIKGPIRDNDGQILGIFGISRDISEQKQAQLALLANEYAMTVAQRLAKVGNWEWDLRSNQHYWSAGIYAIYGRDPGLPAATYPEVKQYFSAASWQNLSAAVECCVREGKAYSCDAEVIRADGEHRWIIASGEAARDTQGNIYLLHGSVQDITERKLSELAQRESATVFSSCYEGILMVSPDLSIMKVNPAFTRITGYTEDEVRGQSPRMLSSKRHGAAFYDAMWKSIAEQDFWRGEIWNRRKNGEIYTELLAISTVRDEAGKLLHYVGIFSDITELKSHEAELDRIAHYDALTGLPNRRLLADRLNQAVIRCTRSNKSLAVCFLDLDGFKEINDHYGHEGGDRLLIGVSENIKKILRADDTLARLGGDEFVLLLSDISSSEECTAILDRVLHGVSRNVEIRELTIGVTASIGVCLFPDDNADPDTLLRHADQAMYQAKENGKNRYHMFDPENDRRAQLHRRMQARLQLACEQHEFLLYYQPKVNLLSGEVIGAEALIRWQHPERGVLAPIEFLPYIYGNNLEAKLGEWVIQTALAQIDAWRNTGLTVCISANVSAQHLLQPDFYEHLQQALAMYSSELAQYLELEVLETAALADLDQAIAILNRCRDAGVHISLDDFGTGYSSLTYLRKLPVNTLKIDQSFVRDMLDDRDDHGIVEGVIRLANAFGREVIAEGVETLEHGAALMTLGCYQVQGYGIAKPMPAEDFYRWVQTWKSEQLWLGLQERYVHKAA